MTVEGWWGDDAPAKKDEGATPKGQTQAPVKSGTVITAPKVTFRARTNTAPSKAAASQPKQPPAQPQPEPPQLPKPKRFKF